MHTIDFIFLSSPDPHSLNFKILLIASEIIIPIIVGVGVYYIFKPIFNKEKAKAEAKQSEKSAQNKESEDQA
ncbi:MAG: hypothetical protein ACI8ZN_001210 [Bacteroidia bacterium]|jgi:hypothetical protein